MGLFNKSTRFVKRVPTNPLTRSYSQEAIAGVCPYANRSAAGHDF